MHYTYRCPLVSAGFVGYLYLQNHWNTLHKLVSKLKEAYVGWLYLQIQWVTLLLWVSSLKCRLYLLGILTQSLSYNTLMVGPP